jgi:hypothetical protein
MARKSVPFEQWLKKNHPKLVVLGMHYDADKKKYEALLGTRVVVPKNVIITAEDEDKHVDGVRKHLRLPGIE